MTSRVLCVDFGASRVKAAVWCGRSKKIEAEITVPSPKPHFGMYGEVEVDPSLYWDCLDKTAGDLLEKYTDLNELWLCTEMHGFALARSGNLVTKYISWRDERAIETLLTLRFCNERFRSVTGMNLRAGLPFLTLAHLKSGGRLEGELHLCTLADVLLIQGGETCPKSHISLAAGTGFYDIWKRCVSDELLELSGCKSILNCDDPIFDARTVKGRIRLRGREIEVRGCVGDLPAAIAPLKSETRPSVILNLGTGSQVVFSQLDKKLATEYRVDGYGDVVNAISHIPSGRSLAILADFVDSIAQLGGRSSVFWEQFQQLTLSEVIDSTLSIDLKMFKAARNYSNGGCISGIHEDNFTVRNFIAGAAKSWLMQYVSLMDCLDPQKTFTQVSVLGGLSRRGKFIKDALEELSGRSVCSFQTISGEETLDGLIYIANGGKL